MVVHLREDGSAERMDAEGAVTLTDGDGGRVVAPRGSVALNAESRPQSAVLTGGLHYVADEPLRQAQGEATEGRASFDKAGHLQHVVLTGAAKLQERVRASDASALWSERDLSAGTVELGLVSEKAGKPQLQDAKASGDARLKIVSLSGKPGHVVTTSSDLAGDVLTAHLVPVEGVRRISVMNGAGHTFLRQVNAQGVVNTSSGDALEVHFKPTVGHAGGVADEIASAVQEGNVTITQIPVKKPSDATQPQEEKATAARAVYDGATQKLTLTGNVQMAEADSTLWADRVTLDRQTGNAEMDGAVKASYQLSGKKSEPVHVLAARGSFNHDTELAMFYGTESKPVRLWQGGSQVEAPVIQLDRKQKKLVAHGAGPGEPMIVHTVLVSAGNTKPGAGKTEVVRVASRELTYADAIRQAEFSGGVQVDSIDRRMRGQNAVVYLQAAPKPGTTDNADAKKVASAHALEGVPSGFMGGGVERIVATGHIVIDQPGRRATGEHAVYTASDGMFVMTGTAAAPPQLVDDVQGTVTGTSLRFHTGDESVMVSNGVSGGVEGKPRVRTETRVKKDR